MSVYTIQLRNLIENGYKIFDFDYPIFDENYRKVLEQKIIDRYYFREIGLETPAQFKHFLRTRLNEIMPYYNQLYKSELMDYDPLINVNVTETQTRNVEQTSTSNQEDVSSQTASQETTQTGTLSSTQSGESEGTSNTSTTEKEVFQDTPQSKLGDVNYATNITDRTNTNQNTTTNTASNTTNNQTSDTANMDATNTFNNTSDVSNEANTTESYLMNRKGSEGMRYPASVIMEWRKAFLNIDVEILDNLNDLFMGVY